MGRKDCTDTQEGSWKAGEGDSIVWSETEASAPSHYTELPNHFLTAHLPFNLSVVVSQALTRGRMIRFLYFPPPFLGSENLPSKAGDTGDVGLIPGLGRSPGRGNGHLLQSSCLGKSCGQRSLVGYSPQDLKELDRTEHRLHTSDLLNQKLCGWGLEFHVLTSLQIVPTNVSLRTTDHMSKCSKSTGA